MTNFTDPKRTRLPKLLKAMENDNLVVSALQPGPLGPYRRIYEPGPEAENFLIDNLRSALETILHFFDAYRKSIHSTNNNQSEDAGIPTKDGKILFGSFPQVNVNDLDEIRNISANREVSISIIGQDNILCKTGISYDVVGSDITNIESQSKIFSEVHLRGIPPKNQLPQAIAECKRVLCRGGVLRMIAPFVFFDNPEKGTIEEFIRNTVDTRFPELGLVDGNEVLELIEQNFSKYGTIETKQGETNFWAIKS
ncbi:hypothetical protein E4H12_09205 [Candidatus Thorarchaeota archaeon]|nr:MAG: hypothetical protein E4H12_09205 [Candidatus Thorarchaeota archaeon]